VRVFYSPSPEGYPWGEGTSDRPTAGSYNLHKMKVKVKGYIRRTQAMRPKAEQNNLRKQSSY